MLWAAVWSVLVVGTSAGAFFLGRWLWRKAVALGRELSRAGDAAARLGDRADELEQAARTRHPVPPPALGADPADVRVRVEAARAAADVRRAAREERHRAAWARWQQHWR